MQQVSKPLLAALAEIEDIWQTRNLPILRHLQPGLTDGEIDELTAPIGLTLPGEARAWWRWHNGVTSDTSDAEASPGPDVRYCSLADAVAFYTLQRKEFARRDPAFVVDQWPSEWFVLCYGPQKIITIDCSPEFRTETPVRVLDYWDEEVRTPKAASVADMVRVWCRAWASGAYRFDLQTHDWDRDWERLPPDADLRMLA